MISFNECNPTGAGVLSLSEGCHQTCFIVQSATATSGGPCMTQRPAAGSLRDKISDASNESDLATSSFPPSTSTNLFWRLVLIIALALPLLVAGMVFFINGFFLSRDDLPFISGGSTLPFPPLFPHLHPVPLYLNNEEGVYYVRSSSSAPSASDIEQPLQSGDALTPLDMGSFLTPRVDLLSTEVETCQTADCRSSWLSVTPFDRVVILLIDAMRFDFLLWDPEATQACGNDATSECEPAPSTLRPFYRNRLPFVHDLLRRSDADLQRFLASLVDPKEALNKGLGEKGRTLIQAGMNPLTERPPLDFSMAKPSPRDLPPTTSWGGNSFTRLYLFEADPPTATTQRLKGLATGSMPSFFSIRETFSASAVKVDSLLLQLKAANKTSVAIGDDTWDSSFGHLLTRKHVFPSLNIHDLHTVDDGVKAELPRQFAKGDWSFLVGHALGVDHVGHAAVLDSELMEKKLAEVNSMIKNTLQMILNEDKSSSSTWPLETLFLVFGDHGMTEAGAHGGDSSEEVEAGFVSFSTLPAFLSPRAAQELSPATRLVENRLPAYLQSHGAFRDNKCRRRVGWSPACRSSSPTPTLGYGSLRVRQVGLAPTLSLLMGLPIPFNSMGRVMADLIPSLASFVPECAPANQGRHSRPTSSTACGTNEGNCSATLKREEKVARTVRCSDLAYLTQLHHITAWQQHRAISTHATLTGNDAVLMDPQFAFANSKWQRLYFALDKELKTLPAAAHVRLTRKPVLHNFTPSGADEILSLPPRISEAAEEELLRIFYSAKDAGGAEGTVEDGQTISGMSDETSPSLASALPSLVPYLLACAEFSQEAFLASVRQLGTFNLQLMQCGMLLTLSSLLILVSALLGLKQPLGSRTYQTPKALIAHGLPEATTIARWLGGSTFIGGAIWLSTWAFSEIFRYLQLSLSAAIYEFVWRQLPILCVTGALCCLVIPFARCTLRRFLNVVTPLKWLRGVPKGEAEPRLLEQQSGLGFTSVLRRKLCLSHFGLDLFGGGTFLSYASMFVLCIVPFSDCFVDRECNIVKFLITLYCVSAGIAAFSTPSSSTERSRIASACVALMVCVRLGSAFDPSEIAREQEGTAGTALQVDYVSSAVFFMICIFCVAGKKELPFISRLLRPVSNNDSGMAPPEFTRFRALGFQPLKGHQGRRPCSLERAVFLVQGIIALLWFSCSHVSKSQKASSQAPHGAQASFGTMHVAAAWMWSAASLPFKVADAVGEACLSRFAPPKDWMFSAPQWLLGLLPPQLLERKQVKLVPLLNVFLPWSVYMITGWIWLRLVFILCHMKKRENDLSTLQLRRAEAGLIVLGDKLSSCSPTNGHPQRDLHNRVGMIFGVWRVEVWEYFSHYLLLSAVCPLCMYAMLLGRAQLWPLLLCCVKWRLLLFLSRILVIPSSAIREQTSGVRCKCCFCRASAKVATDSTASGVPIKAQSGGLRFLLSNTSVCMLAALLALDTFFTTGHRMKLSALPIEAGFIGLLEFHPVWSIVSSLLHTYTAYMICCPLQFMIVFLRLAHAAAAASTHDEEELQGSTADAVVQNTLLKFGKLAFGILIGVTLRHLCSLLSLTALRSHLFIWDVFAVKFLYDVTAVCLAYLLVILTLLLVSIGIFRAPKVLPMAA